MRLLSITFLARFPMQVINLHPALPGTFPGTHAIERAFAAYQAGQIRETGIMVHFVPDEQVDAGPVIAQRVVPIEPTDTLDTFAERVHQTEWQLLVAVLQSLVQPD
jgi:phosphoribosylglycinamide formyltransferase-1